MVVQTVVKMVVQPAAVQTVVQTVEPIEEVEEIDDVAGHQPRPKLLLPLSCQTMGIIAWL